MPNVPLKIRTTSFTSNQNLAVASQRIFAGLSFIAANGSTTLGRYFLVDTGAPFSVIPPPIWDDLDIVWQKHGDEVTEQGQPDSEPLLWDGHPCDLGDADAFLYDPSTKQKYECIIVEIRPPTRLCVCIPDFSVSTSLPTTASSSEYRKRQDTCKLTFQCREEDRVD